VVRTPLLVPAGQTTTPPTAGERAVALAASPGTSSREVAERLGLSVRTVENHLQRIHAKLGVAGRREPAEALTPSSARGGGVG
jgi:DNA-binding NarL/FixJ family response regulator